MEKHTHPGQEYAAKIMRAAEQYGLSVQFLLDEMNVARSTLTRWRAGKLEPRMSTARRVDAVLERLDQAIES